MVIHYFSDSEKDLKKDCYSMAEQIVECLEYLPFKTTKLRGEDISYEIVDDVLQVFVTYKFMTKKVTEEETTLGTMTTNIGHR